MNKIKIAKTLLQIAKELNSSSFKTAGAKYTLTEKATLHQGHILHRVKYSDGTLGGWIESEKNLQGNAKVLNEAKVYGNAVVKDNAIVSKKIRSF